MFALCRAPNRLAFRRAGKPGGRDLPKNEEDDLPRPGHVRDEGFSLIELTVVVLIIALLVAIAIPTFLGARRRAQDRQAQSNLRNGLSAEKIYYADSQVFTMDTTRLAAIEPNLNWSTDDAAARGVQIMTAGGGPSNDQSIALKSLSKSGTVFCIMDIAKHGHTYFGKDAPGTYYAKKSNGGSCTAPNTWFQSSSSGW